MTAIAFKGRTPTFKEVRDANKASERAALRRAGWAQCRTCGKLVRGVVESVSIQVTVVDGTATLETWKPTGTFGYHGTGICSLRCGFRWAHARAPKRST